MDYFCFGLVCLVFSFLCFFVCSFVFGVFWGGFGGGLVFCAGFCCWWCFGVFLFSWFLVFCLPALNQNGKIAPRVDTWIDIWSAPWKYTCREICMDLYLEYTPKYNPPYALSLFRDSLTFDGLSSLLICFHWDIFLQLVAVWLFPILLFLSVWTLLSVLCSHLSPKPVLPKPI